jgi:5-methylcytosine-specific restriction endonuclease McrA
VGIVSWFRGARQARREDAPSRRNRNHGTHCFYCGAAFEPSGPQKRTVDHRLPRARKGSHRLVNLVFACRACNERKADRPEGEFVASAWLGARRREVSGDESGPGTG